jgi:alpha-1,6-mannosyltransferase
MPRHRLRRLLLPGGVLLLSYVSLFVIHLRNSLSPLAADLVPPDLGYSAAANPRFQLLQMICLACFFMVYGITLWNWRRLHASPRTLAWSAAVVGVLAWSLLPADSSDVLEYIGFGRLAAVYHVSPYLHTYSEFTDRFASSVTWDDPMPYGPVVLPVFALAGLVSEGHLFVAMYLIKLAWLLIHFMNAWLIYRLAKSITVDPRYALFVFAFNPLILLEQLANGHNDGPLILFGLLAVLALQRGRGALAVVVALLSALIKTSGLFWVAGIVVLLIRQRRWRAVILGMTSSLAVLALVFQAFPGFATQLAVMSTQWQYTEDSLHAVLIGGSGTLLGMFNRTWEYDDLFRVDRLIFSTLFIVVCARRFASIRDVVSLIRELALVLLALLLGCASSLYPWYVAWLLPMAALTDSAPLRRTILAFSVSVFALYAFPYAMLEESPHRMVWRGMRLVVAFGVPTGFWISQGIMEWGSARALARSPACLRKMPELLRGYPPPENALESRQTDSFMPS